MNRQRKKPSISIQFSFSRVSLTIRDEKRCRVVPLCSIFNRLFFFFFFFFLFLQIITYHLRCICDIFTVHFFVNNLFVCIHKKIHCASSLFIFIYSKITCLLHFTFRYTSSITITLLLYTFLLGTYIYM